MLINFLVIVALLVLFYFLGKAADLTITNVKIVADKLGIKIFFIGIILGFITTLPEMAVGINALMSDLPAITLGNLFGGIMVLLGLILGVNLILHRGIKTDGNIKNFAPIVGYLFLPLILSLDGKLSFLDGMIIILAYLSVIYYLYLKQKHLALHVDVGTGEKKNLKYLFLILVGIVSVIIISDLIIRVAEIILDQLAIPAFILGLLVFAIGTNLPEITLALKSWRRKVKDLSMSNLLGSSMSNMLLLGVFATFKTFNINLNFSFFLFFFFLAVLACLLVVFYKTGKEFSRKEGFVLLSVYGLFVIVELFFLMFY